MTTDILKLDLMDGKPFTITGFRGIATGTYRLRTGIHSKTVTTYFLQKFDSKRHNSWIDYPDQQPDSLVEFGDFEMLVWLGKCDELEIDYSKIKVKKL